MTSRRLQAGAGEQVDQPHLLVGGDDLGLVLEAVAGADLADADTRWASSAGNLYAAAVSSPVVLLAGGTGGAKLARGMLDEVGADLVVIANTGDDVEIHGGYVSPDPDLVLYWLADRIDERGWGIRGDTFAVMDALRELGEDVWFNLGDRDLAVCLQRARRLAEGARLTETLEELRAALGVAARVLPPTDAPIRTHVRARGEWFGFQEFMIREGGPRAGRGRRDPRRGPGRRDARRRSRRSRAARAVVIGPSNPVISIGPILAVAGIADALRGDRRRRSSRCRRSCAARCSRARPTSFMAVGGAPAVGGRDRARTTTGLIDGLVSDERASGVPTLETDVEMGDADARRRVALETLMFAAALRG